MFGWLTGSSSIECSPDYDSSIEPGKKGMISEPIEDMTVEKFRAPPWERGAEMAPGVSMAYKKLFNVLPSIGLLRGVSMAFNGVQWLLDALSCF